MVSIYGNLLQETAASVIRDLLEFFRTLIVAFWQYILIVLGLIALYFILTRVVLRGTTYKTAAKEPTCVLTMSGRERSLEYLERFGGIRGVEAQAIRYLRKHGEVPRKQLEKVFGTKAVKQLAEDGFISII
ncbi:MAG: hypothetical protein HXS44_08565 [Theionarchaea archaeon]|nr:hypothetical protein [Theionarchaea archaeon]